MGNLIQRANQTAIQANQLTLANEPGTGGAVVVAPTGATYQMKGLSSVYSEHTSDYTIAIEESYTLHTNRGAATVINATLPSGAPAGWVAGIHRMGLQMNVRSGDAAEKFWMPTSGYYKPVGQSLFMASSGASAFFVKGSNSDWIPYFPAGTLT